MLVVGDVVPNAKSGFTLPGQYCVNRPEGDQTAVLLNVRAFRVAQNPSASSGGVAAGWVHRLSPACDIASRLSMWLL